jgi:hypothetical protein
MVIKLLDIVKNIIREAEGLTIFKITLNSTGDTHYSVLPSLPNNPDQSHFNKIKAHILRDDSSHGLKDMILANPNYDDWSIIRVKDNVGDKHEANEMLSNYIENDPDSFNDEDQKINVPPSHIIDKRLSTSDNYLTKI